jgi:hypothetical protein
VGDLRTHLPIASNKDITKALVVTSHSIPKNALYSGFAKILKRSSQKLLPSVTDIYACIALLLNALTMATDAA